MRAGSIDSHLRIKFATLAGEGRKTMHKPFVGTKILSRRRFLIGSAAMAMLASTDTRAADLRYRLGLSQPVDSPNYIRLKEMADNVRAETAGRMQIDLYPAGQLGSDNVTLSQLYQVCKDRTVDGQTDPLGLVLLMKLYEVQTYLSLTNHWWSGFTLTANAQAWKALPADIQAIVQKHADAAALAQRSDIEKLNAG